MGSNPTVTLWMLIGECKFSRVPKLLDDDSSYNCDFHGGQSTSANRSFCCAARISGFGLLCFALNFLLFIISVRIDEWWTHLSNFAESGRPSIHSSTTGWMGQWESYSDFKLSAWPSFSLGIGSDLSEPRRVVIIISCRSLINLDRSQLLLLTYLHDAHLGSVFSVPNQPTDQLDKNTS